MGEAGAPLPAAPVGVGERAARFLQQPENHSPSTSLSNGYRELSRSAAGSIVPA